MIKKVLFHSLFGLNIVALILSILQIFLFVKGYRMEDMETFMFWKMNITYFVFAFWIWSIVIWSKKDKKVGRFIALFFLPGFFTLIYYKTINKNKWI
jgi:hypothetical protein